MLTAQNNEVKRLTINSNESEYAPFCFDDGIVFVSHRKTDAINTIYDKDGNYASDIYFSKLKNGELKKSKLFSSNIQSNLNEGPFCFNSTEDQLFYTLGIVGNKRRDQNHLSIFISNKMADGTWSKPKSFIHNSPDGSYDVAHPAISFDGRRLFFASNKSDSFGGYDLYFCVLDDEDEWGEPIHLDEKINTQSNEGYPHYRFDGRLYFSSSGHSVNNGMDILYTRQSKSGNWSEPVLLDFPINSDKNDFSIAFNRDGKTCYFASDRDMKSKEDIFSYTFDFPTFEDCFENYDSYFCYTFRDDNINEADDMPFQYTWIINNEISLEGIEVSYCFPGYGSYVVQLQIHDTLTHRLYKKYDKKSIEITKKSQPHITSFDTIFVGETIEFIADEFDHVPFESDEYYWRIEGLLKEKGIKTEYKFMEPGTYQIDFMMINFSNSKEKICVSKEIIVILKE